MSKKLRNLKFLNQQVMSVVSHEEQKVRADGLHLLCSITNCNKWSCEECPVQRESVKPENQNV